MTESALLSGNLFSTILSVVGLLAIGRWVYRRLHFCFRTVRLYLFPQLFSGQLQPTTLGEWAIVTGGTSGIGREYCEELGKQGVNIVIISRSLQKLEDTKTDLIEKYNVQVKIIVADFTDTKIYSAIEEALEGLDIGLLINNVGLVTGIPSHFLDVPDREEHYRKVVQCNIYSVVFMTSIVLPKLEAKHKGAIINVSSQASIDATHACMLSVYGATKAFVRLFSETIAREYKPKGVHIQNLLVGPVNTNMLNTVFPEGTSDGTGLNGVTVSAQRLAQQSLASLGLTHENAGCFTHECVMEISGLLPPSSSEHMMTLVRSRALKLVNKSK